MCTNYGSASVANNLIAGYIAKYHTEIEFIVAIGPHENSLSAI